MNEFKAKMTLLELTHDAREDGFPVETVMKYTGLTAEQIAAL